MKTQHLNSIIQELNRKAQHRRMLKSEMGIWVTARADEILILKLTDEHLARVLDMYSVGRSPFNFPGIAERMAAPLIAEARRRGVLVEQSKDRFQLIEID